MGSIEQIDRASGTSFRAIPWNAAMRKKGKTRTFSGPDAIDRAQAYIAAEERRVDGVFEDAGVPVVRNRDRRHRFPVYAAAWVEGAGNEWATRKAYRSHVRTLSKEWPDRYLDEIDGNDIKRHLAAVQAAGRGPGTRAARLTVLRGIFGQAYNDGLIERNPVAGIRQAKHRRTPAERRISEAQMWKVYALLPDWIRAGALLSYDSGLRVGEVCGLHWSAVDLDGGFAMIGPVVQNNRVIKPYPKGGEVLPVPLSQRTVLALREHQRMFPRDRSELVFAQPVFGRVPGKHGTVPLPGQWKVASPHYVGCQVWRRAVEAAGITDPRPRWHDLRHACAHGIANSGAAAHVLQAFMRHGSLASTQTYMPVVSAGQLRTAVDASRPDLRIVFDERDSA